MLPADLVVQIIAFAKLIRIGRPVAKLVWTESLKVGVPECGPNFADVSQHVHYNDIKGGACETVCRLSRSKFRLSDVPLNPDMKGTAYRRLARK